MPRKAAIAVVAALLLCAVGANWLSTARYTDVAVQGGPPRARVETTPMCPWRQPLADMRVLFPKADRYDTVAVILSSHLVELKEKLGRWPTSDENPLYLHRVYDGNRHVGNVVARRVKGEHGAIEIVLAISSQGNVAGLRLQRLREPDAVARVLTSRQWLHSFTRSNLPDSDTLTTLPPAARQSARAIVEGVRSSLILLKVTRRQSHSPNPVHH